MDKGVKIAIFVASVVSLGLGLVWDQVLSQARTVVETPAADELGPEIMDAHVGNPDTPRFDRAIKPTTDESKEPTTPKDDTNEPKEVTPDTSNEWIEYTVRAGDSWWRIAHERFKDRGLESSDIASANKGVKLIPGKKIKIPPGK